MKKLSKTQIEVLSKLSTTVWHSAYSLQCRQSTLDSLTNAGYCDRRTGNGSVAFPRTDILFKLK